MHCWSFRDRYKIFSQFLDVRKTILFFNAIGTIRTIAAWISVKCKQHFLTMHLLMFMIPYANVKHLAIND
jgi:hypothetical protein